MSNTINRLIGSIALPGIAAAVIAGAAIGFANPATAEAVTADSTEQTVEPGVAHPPQRPYWNDKRGYYNYDKGLFYQR